MTRKRVLLGVAALAAAAGLVVLAWTWRHPTAFREAGGWGVRTSGPLPVGDVLYVGMTSPADGATGQVTLHGGHANVDRGADIADAELLLCTIAPDAEVGSVGAYRGDLIHDDCSDLVPIDGRSLDLTGPGPRQQVVLALALSGPGTVHISGITLDYAYGWQRGSQRTGGAVDASTERLDDH